jgi:hypothetical protein
MHEMAEQAYAQPNRSRDAAKLIGSRFFGFQLGRGLLYFIRNVYEVHVNTREASSMMSSERSSQRADYLAIS